MAYQFYAYGETYIGRVIPGAARMRIFHSSTDRFVVAFDPDIRSLRGNRPSGSWANIQPDTHLELLEAIEPQLLAACQARLQSFA